jgi:hypothetical protein
MVLSYTMDPNTGYPAGYPVPTQTPPNQMPFYPNSMPQYPQSKTPLQSVQQQQHSFGAMPMQPGGPGGAMMPTGFPPQTSGTWSIVTHPFPCCAPFIMISPTHPSPFPGGVDLSLGTLGDPRAWICFEFYYRESVELSPSPQFPSPLQTARRQSVLSFP